jgi:hypothetical protein
MGKQIFLSLLILLVLPFFQSCKENELPEGTQRIVDNNDDLRPNPPGAQDPPEPTPGPTPLPRPNPGRATVQILPYDLANGELGKYKSAYRKKYIPFAGLKEPAISEDCAPGFIDRCVVNRQVLFQFFTETINKKYPKETWGIKSIQLTGSFYTIAKNHKTESICMLNNKKCSGVALTKFPKFGLPLLVKLFVWEKDFWAKKTNQTMVNNHFFQLLSEGWSPEEKLFKRENLALDLTQLFALRLVDFDTLVRKNKSLIFSISDDTFVENPSLILTLESILP